MKRLLILALAIYSLGRAQFPATFLGLPPPPPIATYRGPTGSTDRYYWLVARYPGFIYSAVSLTAAHVVTVAQLDLGSRVDLSWQPIPGAIGYDLLRTSTNSAPTGACNCAVSVNNISAVYDDGHNLLAYTVATASGVAGGITGSGTSGSLAKFTGTTAIGNAAASDVVAEFSSCSGTQYLGADGACHTPSAGATISGTDADVVTKSGTNGVTVPIGVAAGVITPRLLSENFTQTPDVAAPTAALGAAGNLTTGGHYSYTTQCYDANGNHTNASQNQSNFITVANNTVAGQGNVTGIPVCGTGGANKDLVRDDGRVNACQSEGAVGGSGCPYYVVASLADATTTYTDNISDATLATHAASFGTNTTGGVVKWAGNVQIQSSPIPTTPDHSSGPTLIFGPRFGLSYAGWNNKGNDVDPTLILACGPDGNTSQGGAQCQYLGNPQAKLDLIMSTTPQGTPITSDVASYTMQFNKTNGGQGPEAGDFLVAWENDFGTPWFECQQAFGSGFPSGDINCGINVQGAGPVANWEVRAARASEVPGLDRGFTGQTADLHDYYVNTTLVGGRNSSGQPYVRNSAHNATWIPQTLSADRTVNTPDAASTTVQSQTCGAGNAFSALSGTTGALTCSPFAVGTINSATTNQAAYYSGATAISGSATLRRVPVSGNDWGIGTSSNGLGFGPGTGDCYYVAAATDTTVGSMNFTDRMCQTAPRIINTPAGTQGQLWEGTGGTILWRGINGGAESGFLISANSQSGGMTLDNGSYLQFKNPAQLPQNSPAAGDLVKIVGGGTGFQKTATTDTGGAVGVWAASNYFIPVGTACVHSDNANTNPGDWFIISATTAGAGHSQASKPSCGNQIIGHTGAFNPGGGPCSGSNMEVVLSFDSNTCGGESGPVLSGTTSSIGGGALLAGACATGNVTITGATTSMVTAEAPLLNCDPTNGAALGVAISSQVISANTVRVSVCAPIAGTPTACTYGVRVFP